LKDFFKMCLYQKNDRALPGNLHSRRCMFLSLNVRRCHLWSYKVRTLSCFSFTVAFVFVLMTRLETASAGS
jgi:hypothetical protein